MIRTVQLSGMKSTLLFLYSCRKEIRQHMYIVNYKSALRDLEKSKIDKNEANKYFFGYCIIWGVGILGIVATGGGQLLGYAMEGIALGISYSKNKDRNGQSRDFWARYTTIAFPAYFYLLLYWGIPCIFGGVLLTFLAGSAGIIIATFAMLIGNVVIITARVSGISNVAKKEPAPINLFEKPAQTSLPETLANNRNLANSLSSDNFVERMRNLHELQKKQVLVDSEYRAQKAKIINEFIVSPKSFSKPEKILISLANLRDEELLSDDELNLLKHHVIS